jgi:hypothetical protein
MEFLYHNLSKDFKQKLKTSSSINIQYLFLDYNINIFHCCVVLEQFFYDDMNIINKKIVSLIV